MRYRRNQWKVATHAVVGRSVGKAEFNTVKIEADYHRIVDGDLIFRNFGGEGQYPTMVHTFARGHWLEVKRA